MLVSDRIALLIDTPRFNAFQLHPQRWSLLSVQLLVGIFSKCRFQRVHISALEEDEVLVFALYLFDGKIDAIFSGDSFKGFDTPVLDFDAGNALILAYQLLDRLFAVRCHILVCLRCIFRSLVLRQIPSS